MDWSEGDLEEVPQLGKVFKVKVDATFMSEGDKKRFYAHELAHPYLSATSPIFADNNGDNTLLPDAEGIVEADARIGLGLQARDDMKLSTHFIANIKGDELALPADIGEKGYDHPSFINKTVSLNPGYASSFLWFFGQAISIGEGLNPNGKVDQQYRSGRDLLLELIKSSRSVDEYTQNLKVKANFDRQAKALDRNFLLHSRKQFLSHYAK